MDRSGTADAELLEAWRAGQRDAGDELLRRHFLGVFRFFAAHPGVDGEESVVSRAIAILERR